MAICNEIINRYKQVCDEKFILSSPLKIPYANTEDLILNGAYIFEDMLQQHYTSYESLTLRKLND